jgi:hypothetical protein
MPVALAAGCLCGPPSNAPSPDVLGEARGVVNAVVIDHEHLYAVGWHATNRGFIERVPLAGGQVEMLAQDEGAPRAAAHNSAHLYWDTSVEIKRLAAGGTPTTLLTEGRADAAIAVDDKHVYYASSMRTQSGIPQLLRVPVGGGEPEMVLEDFGSTHFVLSGDWIYFAHGDGASRVHKDDRRVEKLAEGPAQDVFLEGDFLYVCHRLGELHRVPKDGGTDEKLDAQCGDDMLVVDGVSYWTDATYGEGATHLSVGVVARQAPGSKREELYHGELVSNLAAADDHIYFGASNQLLRVPR